MSRAAVAALRASKGAIVITASIAGKQGYPNMSAYCASKFAAIGFTQSLAAELAPDGVRVNAICPGMVGTAMWLDHLLPKRSGVNERDEAGFEAAMAQTIPLGRAQTVEDMGEAALYLATAGNVTGVSLSVAGGFEMS
jgi:meso-butanediol dehydrogenase/(S,S)-butanediol dehydrogenase/diacetyl reductase